MTQAMSSDLRVVLCMWQGNESLRRRLEALPGIACRVVEGGVRNLAPELPEAQVLVIAGGDYSARLASQIREQAPKLRFIQLLTAGYERLEEFGVPAEVTVANAGDAWSPSVADQALTLMLSLMRQMPRALAAQARHAWIQADMRVGMRTPDGATMAIVGYGSIGREVARRAKAFGMHVIGVSRSGKQDDLIDEAQRIEALPQVLARADVVLLAVPSSARTRGLFGAAQIAACKPGALVINVARGNIIDRDALLAGLESGQIGGAGLDVTDPEPLPPEDSFWDAPNLIVTPHVSGFSGERGIERLTGILAANVLRFARGEPVNHRIDLPT
jgi:phosphoglycerate dehydrogenase-like enzyme